MIRSGSFDSLMRKMTIKRGNVKPKENDKPRDSEVRQEWELDEERELIELEDRIKEWLKTSGQPQSCPLQQDSSDAGVVKIHKSTSQRAQRKAVLLMGGNQTTKCNPSSAGDITLYHPDFADWRTCEKHDEAKSCSKGNESPYLLSVLDEASNSLSRMFKVGRNCSAL